MLPRDCPMATAPVQPGLWKRHELFEKNSILLIIGILIVVAIGGLIEIVPLFYLKNTIEKVEGMRPYTPLELAGRNIYVREGRSEEHTSQLQSRQYLVCRLLL